MAAGLRVNSLVESIPCTKMNHFVRNSSRLVCEKYHSMVVLYIGIMKVWGFQRVIYCQDTPTFILVTGACTLTIKHSVFSGCLYAISVYNVV